MAQARKEVSKNASAQGRPRRSATRSRRRASSSRRRKVAQVRRDASTSPSAWASIPKHADQMVRGAVVLPHGTGKTCASLVFAKGDKAKEAAGRPAPTSSAPRTWSRRSRRRTGLDFDSVVATPDMMGLVGKLGRVLGPARPHAEPEGRHGHLRRRQGRPRAQGRQVEFRVEKAGIVHARIGKVSFGGEKLARQRAGAASSAPASSSRRRRRASTCESSTRLHDDGPGHQDRPRLPLVAEFETAVRSESDDGTRRRKKQRSSATAQGRRSPRRRRPGPGRLPRASTVENVTELRDEFRKAAAASTRSSRTRSSSCAVKGTRDGRARRRCFVGPDRRSPARYEDPSAPAKVVTKVAEGRGEVRRQGRLRRRQGARRQGRRGSWPRCRQGRAARAAARDLHGAAPQNFVRAPRRRPAQNFVYLLAAREEQLGEGGSE